MTGVYVSEQNQEKKEQEKLAQQKEQQKEQEQKQLAKKEELKTAEVDQIIQPQNDDFLDEPDVIASDGKTSYKKAEKEKQQENKSKKDTKTDSKENASTEDNAAKTDSQGENASQTEEQTEDAAETSAAPAQPEIHFDAATEMGWPLQGNVIMNYSKDQTIYFATLDQYKTNEALIIQGNVNDKISSVADGIVSNIDYNGAETGCTVTVDLGDGYSAVYGQLKEVPLSASFHIISGA